jgi:N6-L-threonylcarbamoyladenine synthase
VFVLGIETSCDETAVALVRDGRLLAQELATQVDVHSLFGGVVPEIASREHLRVLPALFSALMDKAGLAPRDLGVVAVARGPGLLGSLLVGLSFAKGLCLGTDARLVGVNHLHAHLLAPSLEEDIPFPALGVLASGGHTHLYRLDSATGFTLLGRTLDDAAGEAFDKSAKALNLPYPGGALIDALAREAEPDQHLLPRPYLDNDNLDFSFSGLKTAVAQHVAAHPQLRLSRMPEAGFSPEDLPPEVDRRGLAVFCASLNWAIADTLRTKAERALTRAMGRAEKGEAGQGRYASLVAAGGVAANSAVRAALSDLARKHGLPVILPRPALCTDNAAMIARAGEALARAGLFHGLDLEAVPRGRAVPWDFLPVQPA